MTTEHRPSVPNPDVFLLAAERLDGMPITARTGCCYVIARQAQSQSPASYIDIPEIQYLTKVLRPPVSDDDFGHNTWWYSSPIEGSPDTSEAIRTARILGLILLAILAEEGFNP